MTVSDFIDLLNRCEVAHGPCNDNKIPLILRQDDRLLPTVAALEEDGRLLQLRSLDFMTAADLSYRHTLLSAMMAMCYKYKLVKIGFDPSDGEIVLYLDVYLGSATLTPRQLGRCIRIYRHVVSAARKRLQKIVETGKDPGEASDSASGAGEALRDLLKGMAEGYPPEGTRKQPQKDKFDVLLDDILRDIEEKDR